MYAINKKTGSPITGTLEQMEATSRTVGDSFKKEANGRLKYEFDGWTEPYWDTAKTTNNTHGTVFVDAAGDSVDESDVELVATEPTEVPPAKLRNHNSKTAQSAQNDVHG